MAPPSQESNDAAAASQPAVGQAAVRDVPEDIPQGDIMARDILAPLPPLPHPKLGRPAL